MHRASVGSGAHGRALAATPQPWIASGSDNQAYQSRVAETSFSSAAFSSRRQVNLHTYDPNSRRVGYVEVKIGGHPLDHRRILDPQLALPRGPLKLTTTAASSGSRQSLAFESRDRPTLEYSPVKIGGHALDHVPFLDRGMPSRPLWGFTYVPPPPVDAVLVFPYGPLPPPARTAAAPVRISRGIANVYDCSHCGRIRQSPRVQLCCGHAVCSSCLSSDSMRHVVNHMSGTLCLLECIPCNDYMAMEAVVFPPDRIVRVDISGDQARSLTELRKHNGRAEAVTSTLSWKTGGAVTAALALVAGALFSSRKRPAKVSDVIAPAPTDNLAPVAEAGEDDGPQRWLKRVQGLKAPSKLLKYRFVRTLGVGNFAEVMLVRDRKGALCVLKESDKLQEAVNEIHILSRIHSAHVVRIADYFVEEIGHRQFAYIEMEFCDRGDLSQQLKMTGAMNPDQFDVVFRQLCLGLQEIHSHGIIHRDLKPGNVLLTSEGVAKIADFGVSTCLESDLLTHHAAGTLTFMAPEVRKYFLGESVSYNTKADIWSLGALAVAMLSGDPEPRVATRPVDELVEELIDMRRINDRHATLLTRTLDLDPSKRPELSELLEMVPPMNARL